MATQTKQVRLNFDKLTESGLKSVTKKIEKWGLEVDSIDAPNKARRESGFLLKNVTYTFKNGQKMLIRVKSDGTVFQVKLNNKVVPIKSVDNIDKALAEMVDYVQANAKAYEKAKIQREKRKTIKVDTKPVATSRKEKISNAKEQRLEVERLNSDLEAQLSELESSKSTKDKELQDAEKALKKEKEQTVALQKILNSLEKGGQ